jgi:hypothetical protein
MPVNDYRIIIFGEGTEVTPFTDKIEVGLCKRSMYVN